MWNQYLGTSLPSIGVKCGVVSRTSDVGSDIRVGPQNSTLHSRGRRWRGHARWLSVGYHPAFDAWSASVFGFFQMSELAIYLIALSLSRSPV